MLSWSISYQNFALMIWRQIFSSLSRLYVQLWPCRPSFDMLTRSDLDHSCTIYYSGFGVALCGSLTNGSLQVTYWRIILGLITQVIFRGIYAGQLAEFVSNVRHLCLRVIRRWQLHYQYELRVYIVGGVTILHKWVAFCSTWFHQDECTGVCGMDQMDKPLLLFVSWAPPV